MVKYKCKNFDSCSVADSGKEFELSPGADDKCPECTMTLAAAQPADRPASRGAPVNVVAIAGLVVGLLVLGGGGYSWWRSKQVVVLTPDSAPAPQMPTSAASLPAAAALPMAVAPDAAPSAAPVSTATQPAASTAAELIGGETVARMTCDEATKAKRPDAESICRRAAAVTLLNSGAQAAVAGKLDQAERDYAAARDKDADIPELYFNLAVLKARQDKPTEAIDNLSLAASKGLKRLDLIQSEPAFSKLRADPALKAKLDAIANRK